MIDYLISKINYLISKIDYLISKIDYLISKIDYLKLIIDFETLILTNSMKLEYYTVLIISCLLNIVYLWYYYIFIFD